MHNDHVGEVKVDFVAGKLVHEFHLRKTHQLVTSGIAKNISPHDHGKVLKSVGRVLI